MSNKLAFADKMKTRLQATSKKVISGGGGGSTIMLICILLFINFIFFIMPTLAPYLNLTTYLVDWLYLNILLIIAIISVFYYSSNDGDVPWWVKKGGKLLLKSFLPGM